MKLKKVLATILAAAMVLSTMSFSVFAEEADVWDGTSYSLDWLDAGDPEGTAGDEFHLNSAEDLAGLAHYVNTYASTNHIFEGDTIYLEVDVDLDNCDWDPIGTAVPGEKNRFYGSFDGKGHTISNLKIADGHYYAGLFGQIPTYTYTQEFKNITINNANVVSADEAKSKEAAGALIGRANGSVVENCHVTGDVYISGDRFVGGLLGHSYAQISECSVEATGTIKATTWQAGGLVGTHGATAEYTSSVNDCSVIGKGDNGLNITSYYASVGGAIGEVSVSGVGSTIMEGITVANVSIAADSEDYGSGIAYVASGYTAINSTAGNVSATLGGEECVATDAGSVAAAVALVGNSGYATLQEAIDAAVDGDIIKILAGEYKGFDVPENKKNLTFVGETDADGNNLVTIKTLEDGITSHNGGIFVGSETTTFKNLNFTAGTTPGARSSWMSSSLGNTNGDTGMRSSLKNLTVENCNFTGSGAYQAIWTNQGNVTVKNSTITKYDTAVDTYGIGAYQKMEIENTKIADVRNAFHTGEAKVGSQIVVTKTTIDSDVIDIGGAVAVTVEESTIKKAAVTTYASSTFAVSKSALYDTTYAVGENATGSITLDAVYANNVNELATNANVTIFTYYADEEMKKLVDRRNAMVIETAKSTGATIMLNNLSNQSGVDIFEDATYKVVVSTAPTADVAAANEAIKNNNADTNTEKAIFDISVMKTDSNGTVKDVSGAITSQDVTLTLSETPANDSVKVYHVNGTNVDEITDLSVSGNTVTFVAPSFSTYAVTYTPTTVSEDEITDKIGVVFSPVAAGSNQYYITLKSFDGKKIYRYMSADIAFKNNCATVGYDIEPAANMTASVASVKDNSTEYHFEMDGTRQSSATSNDGITIGTITFYGYGKLDFSVDKAYTSNHAINIVNTAEAVDNIVANYTIGGATKELIVNELKASPATYVSYYAEDENGTITDTLSAETKNLTINVKFNNIISDNEAAYQDMKVTVSGGDLTSPIVKNFGSEGGIALNGDTYTVKIADTLTKNVGYTVKVEGAGYRTARYNVNMTQNKTLNFWNNVKDNAEEIEADKAASAVTKNFLAGDIVKDNNINIYDLSAVVSYFGTENLVSAHSAYAKYDLNRDGVIDSKDVAYVLVSWGE